MFAKYLKKVDMLSESPSLNFRGDSRIVSGIGGLLTIIYACLAMLATAYIGQELFARKSPSFAFETRENQENKVFLRDYPIALKFDDYYTNDLGSVPEFLDSIEIQVSLWHIRKQTFESVSFNVKTCDSSFIEPDFLEKANNLYKNKLFCPDFTSGHASDGTISNLGLYITKGFGEIDSSFLTVFINDCDKANPKCKEYNHINGVYFLSIITFDSFSEASNYEDPIKRKIAHLAGQITKSFYARQYINIDYNFLVTDDGWFVAQESTQLFYSIGNLRIEIADFSEDLRHLYNFTFSAPSKEKITKRLYLKVPEIVAFVGGFLKAILISLKVILSLYTNYLFKIEILNEFKNKDNPRLIQNSRFSGSQANQPNQSQTIPIRSDNASFIQPESHLKLFFRSLFQSSHSINAKYTEKLKHLDVITVMKAIERFNKEEQKPSER